MRQMCSAVRIRVKVSSDGMTTCFLCCKMVHITLDETQACHRSSSHCKSLSASRCVQNDGILLMADSAVVLQTCKMSHTIAEGLDLPDADGMGENLSPNRTKVRGSCHSSRRFCHPHQHASLKMPIICAFVRCLTYMLWQSWPWQPDVSNCMA